MPVGFGCEPELTGGCVAARRASLKVNEKSPGRESIKLAFKGLETEEVPGAFGDPVAGDTAVLACLYDDSAALAAQLLVDRGGADCAGKPCWRYVSGGAFRYRDQLALSDGVRSISYDFRSPARGKAAMAGRNDSRAEMAGLPVGVAERLAGSDSITMRFRTSAGLCLGAELTPHASSNPALLKAKKR